MTEEQFNKWLDEQTITDWIVSMRYKYSNEKEWIYSNEILKVDWDYEGHYVWLNDWDEGQEEVEILGCIALEDVTVPRFERERA